MALRSKPKQSGRTHCWARAIDPTSSAEAQSVEGNKSALMRPQSCLSISARSRWDEFKEGPMARHWRKPHRSTSQFNSLVVSAVGVSMLVGTLVFLSRHIYI
jgi:hypothetical protein